MGQKLSSRRILHKPFNPHELKYIIKLKRWSKGMAAIEKALEILKDGEWHSLDALINNLKLPKKTVERVLRFLAEFEFIRLDEEERKVKIDHEFQRLYTK